MASSSLHIHNAHVWTADPVRPWAQSVTIRNGRITAINATVEAGAVGSGGAGGAGVTVMDAQQRLVTPGLIDAHIHALNGGESLTRLDLSLMTSRAEFEAAITQQHAALPPEQWLIAHGWSQEHWTGGELPNKSWLISAADRPVVCYRMDMHMALVNDAVLKMCDLTVEPAGGTIVRDTNGSPTGLMIEAAAWQLVNPLIPRADATERRQHLLNAQRFLHSLGITSIGSMEYQRDVEEVYAPQRGRLTLRCRITLLDRDWPLDSRFGQTFANDDHLAMIGYKAFIDGTLGSRTARMLHDYADDPGNRGMLVEVAQQGLLEEWACTVAAAGLSPSMHAIGDEAARLALNAIDRIGVTQRPRIEHAQQIDLHDIPRFAGRIASMQPLHKADDCRYVRQRLGAGSERLAGTFAFRKLLQVGAVVAFGSDWPVVSPDPMLGMRTAITGLLLNGTTFGESENLSVEETLRAYTTGAAFALGMDDVGIIRQGAAGDLVMFERDPFTCDWLTSMPEVRCTVAGGQVVYDRTLAEV